MSPPPTNRGPKNHFFRGFRNLTATLTANIFGMKHDIHNCVSAYMANKRVHKRASELHTKRVVPHRLKTTWTLVHKRLQIGSEFSPTLRKLCILLHCQASQTEINKRNSTKLCQTVDSTSRKSTVQKLGSSLT